MKKNLAALMLGATAAWTVTSATAGEIEDVNARLEVLERQNAAIRKENAALRANQQLREENTRLKSQGERATSEPARTGARSHQDNSASRAVTAVSQQARNPLQAYAADLPVKDNCLPVRDSSGTGSKAAPSSAAGIRYQTLTVSPDSST